jgi:RNA polymerase sigma-70 factor (ECF subfamily)
LARGPQYNERGVVHGVFRLKPNRTASRLAAAFLEGWRSESATLPDDLEHRLRAHLAIAQKRWPGVGEDEVGYVRHLAAWLASRETGPEEFSRVRPELWLAYACANGESKAIAALEAEFFPEILHAVRGMGSGAVADDLEERLRRDLFVGETGRTPKIAEYAGRGPLRKWLRVVALRLALPMKQREDRERPLEDLPAEDARLAGGDPELDFLKERYREDFRVAFSSAIRQLPSEQAHLLRLHVTDRLSVDQIGTLYGIHRATAARRLAAARETLYRDTREALMKRLRVTRRELDSIMNLVRSHLDVSLAGALATRASVK